MGVAIVGIAVERSFIAPTALRSRMSHLAIHKPRCKLLYFRLVFLCVGGGQSNDHQGRSVRSFRVALFFQELKSIPQAFICLWMTSGLRQCQGTQRGSTTWLRFKFVESSIELLLPCL